MSTSGSPTPGPAVPPIPAPAPTPSATAGPATPPPSPKAKRKAASRRRVAIPPTPTAPATGMSAGFSLTGLSLKWKLIGGGAIAMVTLCVTLLVAASMAFSAGKRYQGEPVAAPAQPVKAEKQPAAVTEDKVQALIDKAVNKIAENEKALSEAQERGRQEALAELKKQNEELREAARTMTWREYQAAFARRGVELTGLTVPVASPPAEPVQQEPDAKKAEPAPVEPAQPEPVAPAAPPQEESAEPQQ